MNAGHFTEYLKVYRIERQCQFGLGWCFVQVQIQADTQKTGLVPFFSYGQTSL
jgi:hypothetical protein